MLVIITEPNGYGIEVVWGIEDLAPLEHQGFDGVEVALVGCPNTGRGGRQGLHQADLDQVKSIR